jgi:hypothetical protein
MLATSICKVSITIVKVIRRGLLPQKRHIKQLSQLVEPKTVFDSFKDTVCGPG